MGCHIGLCGLSCVLLQLCVYLALPLSWEALCCRRCSLMSSSASGQVDKRWRLGGGEAAVTFFLCLLCTLPSPPCKQGWMDGRTDEERLVLITDFSLSFSFACWASLALCKLELLMLWSSVLLAGLIGECSWEQSHSDHPSRLSSAHLGTICPCCLALFCRCWRANGRLKIPPCRCDVILVDVRRKQEFPECKHDALNICGALELLARPDSLLARSSSLKLQLCWTPLLSTNLQPPAPPPSLSLHLFHC